MKYEYLATTKDNKAQKGEIEALDQESAILALKKKGYFIVKINKQKQLMKMRFPLVALNLLIKCC